MELALHETLEVQEMAAFRTISLTKSNMMLLLVSDEGLKEILRLDVQMSTRALHELKEIMEKAQMQEEGK
ncbi:hypothetical protein M3231_05970 [Neobacillus mesonae]|nr:hypothetical protein [Neobacillus mesonae]